jgi:hypothetical protein
VKGAKVIIFSLATLNFLVDIYQEMELKKAPNLKELSTNNLLKYTGF